MGTHAILSPSGAERWLSCPPSARLEQTFPDGAGEAAREGTLAHSLGELLIKNELQLLDKSIYSEQFAAIQHDRLYNDAMYGYASDYATYVIERFNDAKAHTADALLFLEQRLNLTDYVPEGYGTGDVIIIADNSLDIIDLKYGKGVPVSAHENKQMMLYSLGALREFDFIYDIQRVTMTIYQPRLDNISTFEIAVSELMKWAVDELIPGAKLAFEGKGSFKAGNHCKFCRAKAVCKANAERNLQLAAYDFQEPTLLSDTEIADVLARADAFKSWINAVEDYALSEALKGKKWPGYKLVEGRSNRRYLDEQLVAAKLSEHGFDDSVIFHKELLSITALEKAIGKKAVAAHLSDLLVKPPGKPALVSYTDKRPEYNSNEAAINDFVNK